MGKAVSDRYVHNLNDNLKDTCTVYICIHKRCRTLLCKHGI